MSKTGRNDPCPCGSGKKFKNCHWGSDVVPAKPAAKVVPLTFADKIKPYRGMPILKLLAFLQVMPENHGYNFSLEQMAADVLRQMPANDQRPYMPWEELCKAVLTGQGFGDEEPENLFTENIISANGNQIVFPGIYRNGATVLNELLEVILTGENALPDDFKRLIYSGAGLLLLLSNQVAEDLGFERYESSEMADELTLPEFNHFIETSSAFVFDQAFIDKIAELYGYQPESLDEFILDPKHPRLGNEDPEDSIISIKPLLKDGDGYFVFMPTTIVSSLIAFIYEQAVKFDCRPQLMEMLHDEQFYRAGAGLNFLGWQLTSIQLPESEPLLPVKESVWRFDNQKLCYLCYVQLDQLGAGGAFSEQLRQHHGQRVAYLKTIEPGISYEIMTLVVLSETGHGEFFAMPRLQDGEQYLFLTMSELAAMAYDKESDFLTPWKFSEVFKAAAERYRLPPLTGLLNLYAVYRKNHGALADTDQARPAGAMLMILPGYDVALKQEIKVLRDEHAAELLLPGSVRAFANVIRKREYAPIYGFKTPLSPEYRRLLDCFKMPVWVTSYQKNADLLASEIAEALMFWLFRMGDDLGPKLENLSLVQFEFELIIDEKMVNGSEFIVKAVDVSDVTITASVEPPKIQLHIPYDFMYLMARADNLGEKLLLKAALNGIVTYCREAGREIDLTPEQIEELVGSVMQPKEAKMILFTDAMANVELDGRHLPPEHYFQDVDTSYILDNLTNYLTEGVVIPEKIDNIDEKIALCDAVVSGLIKELSRRLKEFDGRALMEWLIKWNERCVFTREIREIRSPAKIACFADFQKEVDEINERDQLLVPTAHAIRTLIEFIAANPPSGDKIPNYADVDILLAMTHELTTWGSASEAMRMGLNNPEMGLLPSGRIGTDKSFQNEVLIPYAMARATGTVAKLVERFESRYVTDYKQRPASSAKTEEADAAFQAEFGVTISDIADITGVLINYGFNREEPCSALTAEEMFKILEEALPDKDAGIIEKTVELMTLLRRPGIGAFPKGYSSKDIFPWRFGRNLSYLRRPLVRLENEDGPPTFFFGFRHLKSFYDNLLFLVFTGKLPENNSELMSSYMGKINHEKGTPFRNEVKDWLQNHTDLQVIEHEVKIEPGGHLPAVTKLGDTDVMAIDHELKIVYSVECKNLVGARNIHEMKTELDLYLGREGQEAKAKINKHVRRDEYLQANPQQLKAFLKLPSDDYRVVSLVLAAEEMPMTYIAKERLPLSVLAFHRLKLEGKAVLPQ